MKKILLLFVFTLFASNISTTIANNNLNSEVIEINEELSENNINKILCVENKSYSRKTFYLWFKGEAVSKISVAGNGEACFEIGQYENEWQWKASKGPDGSKKSFYSGVATFY